MFRVQMYTDNIARLSFGGALIPFQVSVSQIEDGEGRQGRLTQKVILCGAKEPSNFLIVTPPRRCTGTLIWHQIHTVAFISYNLYTISLYKYQCSEAGILDRSEV